MSFNANGSNGKHLKRANPSTIQDKFMVGYQGWFTCADDGEPIGPGHHGWLHWFNYPIPDGGHPNIDLWPDVSEYSPSELYPAPGLNYVSGEQATLFSSRHPRTVQRHFNWMAQHGVDGAFLQRFAGQCDLEGGDEGIRNQRDEIGDRVKEAAEKEGRVFAIMYDVSGVAPDQIQRILEQDWIHLVRNKGVLNSPNYLKEKGKPVISLWGFGFGDSNHNPASVRAIVAFFRSFTPGGAYIIAGSPAHWRTSLSDADPNPEFLDVWLNEFDAISPWTVGRYGDEDDADRFAEEMTKPDIELLKQRAEEGHKKVDYMPVVLPGGSGFNMTEGEWGFNGIKRNGGKFLWKQIHNARRLGVRIMYGAMWDEYDEGTALMPVVQTKRQVPVSDKFHFMALDEDGCDLPSDWYMRICGFAVEGLRSERMIHETFPSKELQDYWSTRPHYEDPVEASASGSGSATESGSDEEHKYQAWLKTQKDDKDEPPPPPYSLEAGEPENAESEPVVSTQPALSENVLTSVPERTSSPVQVEPMVSQVETESHISSVTQGLTIVTQSPAMSQSPPAIDPLSRPLPESTNTHPGPESAVHSVSADSLADDFLRQLSLSSPPAQPSHSSSPSPQQLDSSIGSFGPSLPEGPPATGPRPSVPTPTGSYPGLGMQSHPFGATSAVQSPTVAQGSHHGSGPGPRLGEGEYFPSFPQSQSHHQHSYGHSPGGPQQQQQEAHHQYSSGPSSRPQAQWPPPQWNAGPQSPHSQSSYPDPGGPSPAPGTHSPPFTPSQYSSQPPGPSTPLSSVSPGPHGGAPLNRPPGGYMSQPQYQHPPQRPPQQHPHPSHSGHPIPIASDALNAAFSAVGTFAGDERRRQLEHGVDKLAQTGSKLFYKFTK